MDAVRKLSAVPSLPRLTHFSLSLVPLCDTREAHPLITEADLVTCPVCLEKIEQMGDIPAGRMARSKPPSG